MSKILTKSEAVEQFGTEAQQAHFLKYGKFTNKNLEQALIKTLKQVFETVTPKKQGRAVVYEVGTELEDKAERKDNRKDNGKGQILCQYDFHSLVVDYILKNCKNKCEPMSLNKWLLEIGLIDNKLYYASYDREVKASHLKRLQEKHFTSIAGYSVHDGDMGVLQHFIDTELNKLKRYLATAFSMLKKHKVIMHSTFPIGYNTKKKQKRELTSSEYNAIGQLKRELCEKWGVTLKEVIYPPKEKDYLVALWQDEYSERLEKEFGIHYYYEAHSCVVCTSDEGIEQFFDKLDKLMQEEELEFCYGLTEDNIAMTLEFFKENYSKQSVTLAEGRQKRGSRNGSNRIYNLKQAKQYVPMWEKLLEYYKMDSSFFKAAPASEVLKVELEGTVIETVIDKTKPKQNPLQAFINIKRDQEAIAFVKEVMEANKPAE